MITYPACSTSPGNSSISSSAWFRERREIALTGKGFGIFRPTAYQYLDEAIDVLAAQAPELTQALARVAEQVDDGSGTGAGGRIGC